MTFYNIKWEHNNLADNIAKSDCGGVDAILFNSKLTCQRFQLPRNHGPDGNYSLINLSVIWQNGKRSSHQTIFIIHENTRGYIKLAKTFYPNETAYTDTGRLLSLISKMITLRIRQKPTAIYHVHPSDCTEDTLFSSSYSHNCRSTGNNVLKIKSHYIEFDYQISNCNRF